MHSVIGMPLLPHTISRSGPWDDPQHFSEVKSQYKERHAVQLFALSGLDDFGIVLEQSVVKYIQPNGSNPEWSSYNCSIQM